MCIRMFHIFFHRETVYRIVGFEVDTKSYSVDSMSGITSSNKDGIPLADIEPKDRNQCKLNTKQTSVLELKKGGKFI